MITNSIKKEIERMCLYSYVRGLEVQFDKKNDITSSERFEEFIKWVKESIEKLEINENNDEI